VELSIKNASTSRVRTHSGAIDRVLLIITAVLVVADRAVFSSVCVERDDDDVICCSTHLFTSRSVTTVQSVHMTAAAALNKLL